MKHPRDCHHLLGSLSDFLDGDLATDLCTQIEHHLAECPDCKVVVDTLQKTISLYQTVSEQDTVPDGVRQRLIRRLQIDDILDDKV
jgi:anti-sigma factor (TIGR02949 family)